MPRMLALWLAMLWLGMTCVVSAQQRVPPEMQGHRVWAVVPLIGKGTRSDPKRPMFVPLASEEKARNQRSPKEPPAILGYTMQVSDDRKSALVEFAGLSPQALAFITQSRAPGVKTFERGKATKAEIETEFRKYKKNFELDSLRGNKQ